jgi:hypothetical protein
MIDIFVSWSGERSQLLAEALCYWLPRVHHQLKPWMSPAIPKGKRWQISVNRKLESTDVGLLCVTPENKLAPWLIFEAGALSKRLESSAVCPIVYELQPHDLLAPLDQFQATRLTKEDMTNLILSLNALLEDNKIDKQIINESVKANWNKLCCRLKKIENQTIHANTQSLKNTIEALSQHGFSPPSCSDHTFFDRGYETYELYSTITKTAKHRLYVFGRKNRKLFDRTQYETFFQSLDKRIAEGFDFRVLFLDPNTQKEVICKSSYAEDFPDLLKECTTKAVKKLIDLGINPEKICKMYSSERPCCMMVIDDAVLCAPIHKNSQGDVIRTTDAPFSIVNTHSSCGKELLNTFLEYWDRGKPLK